MQQANARETIVRAAAELLSEGGVRALTTRAVAERAGVQPPTLYRLVGDKDDLIDAVAESLMSSYVATKHLARPHESADPIEALRVAWREHLDFGLAHPALYRLMVSRAPATASPATISGIDALRHHVHAVAVAGLLLVSESRAVDLIHAAGVGTVLALLEQPPLSRDLALAEEMLEAVITAISPTQRPPESINNQKMNATVQFGAVITDLHALTVTEQALLAEWIARIIADEEGASKGGAVGR